MLEVWWREPISEAEERSYILMVSSDPPETAAEPQTATDLMVERWDGKEKSGVSVIGVRVEGCFGDFMR